MSQRAFKDTGWIVRREDVCDLYLEHEQELRRHLTRRLACADTAGDLTQEAFARLLRRQAAEPLDNPRAYLFRIAANLVTDHFRRRARSPAQPPDGGIDDLVDQGAGPDRTLLAREDLTRLKRAIDELPPRRREILLLHKFEGLSYQEIADKLGIAKNTVMVQMMRALAHCRDRLSAED